MQLPNAQDRQHNFLQSLELFMREVQSLPPFQGKSKVIRALRRIQKFSDFA